MRSPYAELADAYFKNATQIVDKYHCMRQITWSFERLRKKIQKNYGKENRLLFKHSKRVLTKRKSKLTHGQVETVEYLLSFNDDLRSAYYLKELFYTIFDCIDKDEAKNLMSQWILIAQNIDCRIIKNVLKHNKIGQNQFLYI